VVVCRYKTQSAQLLIGNKKLHIWAGSVSGQWQNYRQKVCIAMEKDCIARAGVVIGRKSLRLGRFPEMCIFSDYNGLLQSQHIITIIDMPYVTVQNSSLA